MLSCKIRANACSGNALTQPQASQLYSRAHLMLPYVTGHTMQLIVPCMLDASIYGCLLLNNGCFQQVILYRYLYIYTFFVII